MPKKTFGSVACEVPGGFSERVSFESRASLLEWDIILFNPSIADSFGTYESYKGKPSLDDYRSVAVQEATQHWRRELAEALRAGKTIFVFLPTLQEAWIDTGRREYSGTGRNRHTTQIVAPITNYEALPISMQVTASEGKGMALTAAGTVLADYWRRFADRSVYQVLISGKSATSLVITKTGNKTVGALIRSTESSGSLVLLPHIDLGADVFFREVKKKAGAAEPADESDDDEESAYEWTPAGRKFGGQLIEALLAVDAALRQSAESTPPPRWTTAPEYALPREARVRQQLLALEKELQVLTRQKEEKRAEALQEGALRRLLFEKGPLLEEAIIQALTQMGFTASRYRSSQSEFDVVFEAAEGRLIGEAEGKDNKAINVDKLRQLEMNLHEDFARDEITQMAKGALFGNAYRLLPLAERPDYFTAKCVSAAKRNGCALVRTPDLFRVASYLSDREDPEFGKRCREAIMAAAGDIVSFPKAPEDAVEGASTDVVAGGTDVAVTKHATPPNGRG